MLPRPGQDILAKAAFANSALNAFGNAPRTLGVYSPWRNNVDLSVGKNVF